MHLGSHYSIRCFFIIFTGLAFLSDAMEMMILSILAPALHCHWQISQVQQASLTTVVFLGEKFFYLYFLSLKCDVIG